VETALLEDPVTVFMYCLHALRVNVRDAFPPSAIATVIDVVGERDGAGDEDEAGEEKEEKEEEEEEEAEKEEDDENVEDNAVTIQQISDWLQVNNFTHCTCIIVIYHAYT